MNGRPSINKETTMTTSMRSLGVITVLVGLTSLVGCGGHPWRVVREAPPPSPLKGAGPVSVSFDYSKLLIGDKNETDWVQAKTAEDPGYPKKWSELKGSFETHFVDGFGQAWPKGAQPGPGGAPGVHVVVTPASLSIGHYMVFAATATVVHTTVGFEVDGKIAEEIETTGAVGASIVEPSVFQHMPSVAASIGRNSGHFLASRN
jgi:hypothetical protein